MLLLNTDRNLEAIYGSQNALLDLTLRGLEKTQVQGRSYFKPLEPRK